MNLMDSCLGDEYEVAMKVSASFSARRFAINSFNSSPQLGEICLLVHGIQEISPLFHLCLQMRFWVS